jgi:hypothetical protein
MNQLKREHLKLKDTKVINDDSTVHRPIYILYIQHPLSTRQHVHKINSIHTNIRTVLQVRTLIHRHSDATLAEATLRMNITLCIYMHVV